MTQSQLDRRTFLSVGAIGIAASAIGLRTGLAQDATPAARGEAAHPAHIHSGTCEELGDVVFPLNGVAPLDAGATPAASPAASPAAGGAGEVVAESTTDVEASLDDILAAKHAINVHESKENIGNYIACGNLTGPATDGELLIDLEELNDSGYTGQAHLVDNGDGTTTVTITLTTTGDGAVTPVAAGASETTVTVDIIDFDFQPADLGIVTGTTVTWTNVGRQPHTATGDDGSFDTGVLTTGKSASHTFTEPGTYLYVCTLHENTMQAVLVVT